MCVCSVAQSCLTLCNEPTRLLCPWNVQGKTTGAGCHFLLQGIFLTQALTRHLLYLLHWQVNSLPWTHLRKCLPLILCFMVTGKALCLLTWPCFSKTPQGIVHLYSHSSGFVWSHHLPRRGMQYPSNWSPLSPQVVFGLGSIWFSLHSNTITYFSA